jgi:hypothetical protein
MTKFLTAAALIVTLSAGAITASVPAEAAPTYGFSVDGGSVNPFGAVDGR